MACSCSEWTERKRISYVIKSSKSNVEWKVQAEDGEKIKKIKSYRYRYQIIPASLWVLYY